MYEWDDRIVTALARFGVDAQIAGPDTTLDELDLDSLAKVEFVEILADLYDRPISTDEAAGLSTMDDVLTLLSAKSVPS